MEKAKPSSLPANYVSIVELKERWLENQRQQKEKERQQKEEEQRREEELRQQKLREEEEKSKPKPIAAVPKTETDSKPVRGRIYRAKYPTANPSVSGVQRAELEEKKAEEPAEAEKKVKKKKISGQNKKKLKAAMEKEDKADAPPQASGEEEGGNPAIKIEIRAKMENAGQAVQKFRASSANDDKLKGPSRVNRKCRGLSGEAGKGDDKLRRPSAINGKFGDLDVNGEDGNLRRQSGVNQKYRDLPANGEAEKGDLSVNGEGGKGDDDNSRRPRKFHRRGNGGYRKEGKADAPPQTSGEEEGGNPAMEIEIRARSENVGQVKQEFRASSAKNDKLKGPSRVNQKFRGLYENDEAGKGDDKLRRPRSLDVEIRDLAVNGEDDNLRRRQSEVDEKFGNLSVNVEAGKGGEKLRRPSRVNQKCRDLPANGEAEKGDLSVNGECGKGDDDNSWRPRKFDRRSNGGYRKAGRRDGRGNGGSGMVWVKKGEAADGNGGGVESSQQGGVVSGQTETSSSAGPLTLAGKMTKSYPTRQWRQNKREPN